MDFKEVSSTIQAYFSSCSYLILPQNTLSSGFPRWGKSFWQLCFALGRHERAQRHLWDTWIWMYILPPGTWICHEKLLPFVRALGDGEGREILQDIVLLKQRGVHLKQTLFYMAKLPQLPPELAQYRHLWLGWEDFLRIDFTNWFCFALAVGWAVGMPQWNKRKHSSSQTRLSKPCKPTQANSHAAAELR